MNFKIIIVSNHFNFHIKFWSHVYNKFKTKTIVDSLNFITLNNVEILSVSDNKEIYIFHAIFLWCNISVWCWYQITFSFMILSINSTNVLKLFEYSIVMIKSCHFFTTEIFLSFSCDSRFDIYLCEYWCIK